MQKMFSFLKKIKCLFGFHELTSYSKELDFDGDRMMKVGESISPDIGKAFFELAALRCKNCQYRYKGETENNWNLLNQFVKPNKKV